MGEARAKTTLKMTVENSDGEVLDADEGEGGSIEVELPPLTRIQVSKVRVEVTDVKLVPGDDDPDA